ncbi:MAG: trypsin-like peptidase domain-containing protein [Planctomycetes bacterium]|nr:trypsin-like peptidase domain-containing protein [Planctomycetota bacterium]
MRYFASRLCVFTIIFFAGMAQSRAQAPAAEPAQAVVRIKSHGASGTVIATTEGRSWILSCAHMIMDHHNGLDRAALDRVLKMDGPPQPFAKHPKANARIIAYDLRLDLSLIEIDNGPFRFIPVAKRGYKPGKNIRSLGYDEMKWPITDKTANILGSSGDTTYTVEKPWHGRSGGALVDADASLLIGVVQGYEVYPNSRGLYVSHDAILRFLDKHWPPTPGTPDLAPPRKQSQPFAQPFSGPYFPAPGGC